MYLMDPWYGATINSYDWVVSGSSHTWTSSLVMHDPSPVVTVSAPNPSHQQSNVALNTSLNWTNPPNTAFVEVKFGLTNPPQTVIYSGVPIQNLPNSVFPIQLIGNSTYYWQVNSTLQNEVHNSPVWYFSTTHNGLGIQVGNGILHNSATSYPAPYGNYYAGARHQFLVKASELQQAGMTAGMIRNLAFSVSTAQLTPLHWFSIKIGSASTNSLTAWISGLQTVYGSTTCFSGSGWNIHPFTQPYFWNGTDNLVIETIFNNSGISSNAVFDQTATPGYNSSLFFYVNDIIAGNNGISGSAQQRPNLRFNFSTQLDAIPNLRITRSAGNVLVQWDNVYGANHYQVYSSELPNPSDWGTPIANVTTNSYSEAHQNKRFYRIVATTN
jgi:hypothetical protein